MPNYALLSANGSDRPGIVAAIAAVLLESDCNIEDSQMARLGPEFACMLVIRMPEGMVSGQLESRLGHVVGDEVRQAYDRAVLLEQRRELMTRWEQYVFSATGGEE